MCRRPGDGAAGHEPAGPGGVAYLESSPCAYEHAEARVAYGIAARDAGELTRGLTLARACGADTLAARARDVLREGRGWG